MPPERSLPKFEVFVTSDDSSHVSPALEIRSNPGHVPTVSGTDVPGFTLSDDRRYDISERDASLSRRRPPLSRNSTEEKALSTSIGTRTLAYSLSDASHEEIGQKIHRSRTEAVGESNSSWPTEPGSPKKPSRSYTEGNVDAVKVKSGADLAIHISTAMQNMGKIGLDEPKSYLPEEVLSTLMTDRRIKKAFEKPSQEITDFAKTNPKIFAITLLVFSDKRLKICRDQAMEAFRLHNFTDDCLPVEDMSSRDVCTVQFKSVQSDDSDCSEDESDASESLESADEICTVDHKVQPQCRHRSTANAFHGAPWDGTSFTTFFQKQWSFRVPKILEHIFEYPFGEYEILPFVNKNGDIGIKMPGGHFGDVRSAKMLANHQTAIKTNETTIWVAVKEMKEHTGEEYDNHGNWQRETKALKVFNKLRNPHTVRGIGAFTQRGKNFILMEWADGGDLGKVWTEIPDPHHQLTAARVAQFLKQFRGLAYALHQMHNYKIEADGDFPGLVVPKKGESNAGSPVDEPRPSKSVTGGQHPHDRHVHFEQPEVQVKINEPSGTFENWRHGDLKPDNILRFKGEDSSSWLGRLKLADLGRAKQHMDKTGKRVNTTEIFTTLPYDPPEVWTALDKGRSRLVDIWSFGCVLLESVIWLLFGESGLKKFKDRTTGIGSLYWTVESIHIKKAKLSEATFEWINRLLDEDPELRPSEIGSALRDLILLIRSKLLVIQLPADADVCETGCRINIKTLVNELDGMISKGEQNPLYLFSGKGRATMAMPQIAQWQETVEQEKSPKYLSPELNMNGGNIAQRKSSAPWHARPAGGWGVDSYIHDFDDEWKYVDDTPFASRLILCPEIDIKRLLPKNISSILCKSCRSMDLSAPEFHISCSLAELRRRKDEERCEFCAMLLRMAEKSPNKDWVEFDRVDSGLRMNKCPGLLVLTIRRISDKDEPSNEHSPPIQIGLPRIPKGGDPAHFGIMQAWLDDCDKNHTECRSARPKSFPTRVIYVGTTEAPSLRLVESSYLPESEKKALKYVALSYRWGTEPPHRHFVTNSQSIQVHRQEIPNNLPQTLVDAVKTTRYLKIPYLWIDSLCIIQGAGGDFAQEADRMEAVFSSAYFVMAATSADGSSSGFLSRNSRRELDAVIDLNEKKQNPVYFQDRGKDGKPSGLIFVDEPFDDFNRDVLKGPLNQRGWVFQERALARRTIHFTNEQTYFECGEGIRCETLTKMRNKQVGFLGDPNFPSYGMHGSKGGDIVFYEDLYEQYSELTFSNIEDRPFAISGLEQRLVLALREKGGSGRGYWGIFDDYWGRGLLWRRAKGVEKMIRLTRGAGGSDPAPSWSWEGYSGGITFMKPEPRTVEWLHGEVTLPWSQVKDSQAQMTTASYHGERWLRGFARNFTSSKSLLAVGDGGSDDIIYDDDADRLKRGPLKVLIVGRMKVEGRSHEKMRNYVLVLAKKGSAHDNVYERIGAGFMDGSLIDFNIKNVRSVLVE